MMRRRLVGLILYVLAAWTGRSRADQFEQLDGPTLARMLKGEDATPRPSLTIADVGAMPALLRDTRSALVLARTDLGNPARLLVVPELRKPGGGVGEPFPVFVLERLDAFDASEPSTRLASRKDVVVFDGFFVDLDTGQVVPEGQGGDLVFRSGGEKGPRLEPVGEARLYTPAKAPALDASNVPRPTPGKAVVPGDFAGRYRLFADGQLSGTLDLKAEGRSVLGQFRSDLHGTSYPVSGQVDDNAPNKVAFAVQYPRARQEFEGFLWAEGKGAIAGVAYLTLRPAGFFAIREGGKVAPDGPDLGPVTRPDSDKPGRHVVEVVGDRVLFDGKMESRDDLHRDLWMLVATQTGVAPWVLIRAPGGQKYADVLRVLEIVQAAGIKSIRLCPVEGGE